MARTIKNKHGQFCSINYRVLLVTHPDLDQDSRCRMAQNGPIVTAEAMVLFDDIPIDRRTFRWIHNLQYELTPEHFTIENMNRWAQEAQEAYDQEQEIKLLNRNVGHDSKRRGRHAENLILILLPTLSWVKSVRKGTLKEDTQGIDLVATTDVGEIRVQVKSNHRCCQRFRSKHKDPTFAVIRVNHDNREETIGNMRKEMKRVRKLLTEVSV